MRTDPGALHVGPSNTRTCIEVHADEFFATGPGEPDDSNKNWTFCCADAQFTHRDACEFIFVCRNGCIDGIIERATAWDCSPAFLALLQNAKLQGVDLLMLYAG